ncbi:hypothetical protein [Streptomyces sp. NPDC057582]|uniref:hypothetical protein n=1 Tax=Streptomyces sp. NPDC057582 TaxID=3346174 RepID=UPI0036AD22C2
MTVMVNAIIRHDFPFSTGGYMQAIRLDSVVSAYVQQVPRSRDVLDEIRMSDPELVDEWEAGRILDLLEFLLTAFSRPILLPLLRSGEPSFGDIDACFGYIEGLSSNESNHFLESMFFGVFEQFLEGRDIVLRAYRYSLPVTRSRIVGMLSAYPETYNEIRPDLEALDG